MHFLPDFSSKRKHDSPTHSHETPKRSNIDSGSLLLRTLNPYTKCFKFGCNSCSYNSERIMDLAQHMQQSHSTSDYIRFRSKSRYLSHQCVTCGYRCLSSDQLKRYD